MSGQKKMKTSQRWLCQLAEDRRDCEIATEILQRGEPTYTLDEVAGHLGLDKYHLKFRTKRLQKKHRLELDATQK